MRKKWLVILLSLVCANLHAQVRNYIGIVRQQYYPNHVKFLEELRDSLKDKGYATYSSYVDDYLKGGFGSGFIYVDNGTDYVITNNHVVAQAATASIEFENPETGVITKYENLSVLIADDDNDIAILKLKENPFKKGLTLSESNVYDGQEVFSAGFPRLGNDPVWQFGKGIVTNSKARIKDLIDPSVSTIIQHSAQVDSGNSGGPLMIVSKTGTAGYEVIGINTWKALGREATNFALPIKLAKDLIEKSKKNLNDAESKAERLSKLKSILEDSSSDYTAVVKYISYEYVSNNGYDDFIKVLNYASTNVKNRVVREFAYSPLEGLRYAVAYNFYKDFSGEKATDENLSKLEWTKEHGLFRLSSLKVSQDKKSSASNKKASNKKESSGKKQSSVPEVSFQGFEGLTSLNINPGCIFPLTNKQDNIKISPSFIADAEFFWGYSRQFGVGINYEAKTLNKTFYNFFGGEIIYRFPINFDLFCISPKVKAGFSFAPQKEIAIGFFGEVGLELTFNFGIDYFRPGLEVDFRGSSYKITETASNVVNSNVLVKLIFGFSFD